MKSKETYHSIAWEKFGRKKCNICGMSLDEHYKKYNRRFDMHCTSDPKDYSIMINENWECLCRKCHFNEEIRDDRQNLDFMYEIQEFPDDYDISLEDD